METQVKLIKRCKFYLIAFASGYFGYISEKNIVYIAGNRLDLNFKG